MGTAYLLDTNTIIYFLDGLLPEKSLDLLEEKLDETGSNISIISKIELLGWQAPSENAYRKVESFINDSDVFALTGDIALKAIELKRNRKIKLPDAVIAATAIVNDLTLISRNDEDFKKVHGLKYITLLRTYRFGPNFKG